MRSSDEERLARVYRRAGRIQLMRRATAVAAAAIPVLLVGAGLAMARTDTPTSRVHAADVPTNLTLPTVVHEPSTTIPPPPVVTPPAKTPIKTRTTVPVTVPTTAPTIPKPAVATENCGGYFPTKRWKAPDGMVLTLEASKGVVRRGELVTLTLRAKWTGSAPYTHTRPAAPNLIFGHLNGPIYYSSEYDPSTASTGVAGDETFQPGQEKSMSVVWDTSTVCAGRVSGLLPTGTYTVDGNWEDSQTAWQADPIQVQITE